MTPQSTHFTNADKLCGGKLTAILRKERAKGASLLNISRRLLLDHGVSVSVQTVANWCDELGIAKPEKAKAS